MKITIVGSGYVGLVTGACFSEVGIDVVCVDIDKKKIDLVIELFDWDNTVECERVGLKEDKYKILGVDLPFVRIPISSGKNVSAIIELACRNHILRKQGINTAVELEKRIQKSIEGRQEL